METNEPEKGPTIIRTQRKPDAIPGKKWIPVRDNPDKPTRVEGWMLVNATPLDRLPPEQSPMYPTSKPPVKDVPLGGVPRGDRDLDE